MPRGEHHHHEVKSESDVERVWVSFDDEGNELGYHVEPLRTEAVDPIVIPREWLPDFGTTRGPVHVNRGLRQQTLVGFVSGLAGAGLLELAIHLR